MSQTAIPTLSQNLLRDAFANATGCRWMSWSVSRRGPRPRFPVWEDGRRRFEPVPKEALRSDDELGFQPSNDRKIVTYSLEKYC
jgi:hypothetical protein